MNFEFTHRPGVRGAASRCLGLACMVALLLYYLLFAWANRGFELDDALIYLRYIRNLVEGHGLVYNVGVYFNGLTSPLYSYLLAVLALVVGHVELVNWALSALFFFAAALAMRALFQKQVDVLDMALPRWWMWLGAWLFLAQPYFYATYGMETGLYTLLSALLLYFALHQRFVVAGPLAALLFLTRSEGVFLVAAVGLVHVLRHRALPRWDWRTYVLPLALIGACWAFNFFYYGHIMAETGMAKLGQGRSGLWGPGLLFLQVGYLQGLLSAGVAWLPYALGVCVLLGAVALGRSYLNLVVAAYLVMYSCFYVALNIPGYHWYYSPYFAFWPFYAVVGLGFAACRLSQWLRGRGRKALLGGAAAAALLPVAVYSINPVRLPPVVPEYQHVGQYLEQHTPPDSVVAAVEIGIVGYYSRRTIVDILGLVNPLNARFIGERDFDEWIKHYRVDYVVAHKPAINHELSVFSLALQRGLREVCGATGTPTLGLYQVLDGPPGMTDCEGVRWRLLDGQLPTAQAGEPLAKGRLDPVEQVGNYLRLRGWAVAGADVVAQLGAQGYQGFWSRTERKDAAASMGDAGWAGAGFEAVLVFDTPEQASSAKVSLTCLTVRSPGGDVMRLPLAADGQCRL